MSRSQLVGWLAAAGAVLAAVWWLFLAGYRGPSTSEQFASLRAAGVMFSPAERCGAFRPSERGLTVWAARLAETEAGIPIEAVELTDPLLDLELAPLAYWQSLDWALDDASWTAADATLEHRAEEAGALADVFRTLGDYERLDACALMAELGASSFHPEFDRLDFFEGKRAVEFSLLRAARHGDLDGLQRDLEALLLLPEKLAAPLSLLFFDLWVFSLTGALHALEGSLALLVERLDLEALARRLEAFRPRELLSESFVWERSNSLRSVEWMLAHPQRTPSPRGWLQALLWNPARDLAAHSEAFELGARYLRGEGVSAEDIERFHEGLGTRMVIARTLLPSIRDQPRFLRMAETQLALALTALRLARHGREGWESVARELDPYTGKPLHAEPLPDGRLRLRALDADAPPEELRDREWTVRLR